MLPKEKPMDIGVAPEVKRQRQEVEFDPGSDPTASDFAPFLPDPN
jgi:hypothetical protein